LFLYDHLLCEKADDIRDTRVSTPDITFPQNLWKRKDNVLFLTIKQGDKNNSDQKY